MTPLIEPHRQALAELCRRLGVRRLYVSQGCRNRIIRGYDAIDDATVWGMIEGHPPALMDEVAVLLA